MQRAFEKIIERLSNKRERYEDLANQSNFDGYAKEEAEYLAMTKMCDNAIEIVNQVASEYFKENYFNLDNTKLHDCPKCGEKATHRVNKKGSWACGCFKCGLFKSSYDHVKAIQAWEDYCGEYGGGWIPVSSGVMPEERQSIFAKFKGTNKWNDAMFEKISDEVNVTVVSEKGNATTAHAHTKDGKWSCDLLEVNKTYRVIAWQPLPKPYKPKFEFSEIAERK